MTITFERFPKMGRLNRTVYITEKIDGTNGQIIIDNDGNIGAGSRNRLLSAEADNFGFYAWVQENRDELLKLGPGRHFGEWFGQGIGRGYGLTERRFALFNVGRWETPHEYMVKGYDNGFPKCCTLVPKLDVRDGFNEEVIGTVMNCLKEKGSIMVPGFMQPEGIVMFHSQTDTYFKRTFEHDENGKGQPSPEE